MHEHVETGTGSFDAQAPHIKRMVNADMKKSLDAAQKRLLDRWWEAPSWGELRRRLFRHAGKTKHSEEGWAREWEQFFWWMRSKPQRRFVKRLVRLMSANEEMRATFDSIRRTNGDTAVLRAVEEHFVKKRAPKPPVPKEVAKARAREKREEHARNMLAKHERALAREERAVARWRRKVAAHERARARRNRP